MKKQLTLEQLENNPKDITPEDVFGKAEKDVGINDLVGLLDKPELGLSNSADILENALYYLKSGLSIIPVLKDKRPAIAWKEYQTRKPTDVEVRKWFTDTDYQIGIVTGKISNLIVVDVEKGGETDWLPRTAISSTAGGGFHYFYSYVEGVRNSARIKNLTDIRGEAGFVVAAPSKTEKGEYKWVKKIKPVVFPKYLFVKEKTQEQKDFSYPGFSEGQRNSEMASFIGKVLVRVHPYDWNAKAWSIVCQGNCKNTPPLLEEELKITFDSIKEAEKRNNENRWARKTGQTEGVDLWDNEDDQVVHIKEVVERQKIDASEFYKLKIPLFDEALGGGVCPGNLITVSGNTGEGKTTMLQTLAFNLSVQALPVCFFSYEVLATHLYKGFCEMGMTSEYLMYMPLKHTSGDVGWIENKIREAKEKFQAKIFFIDHLGFLLSRAKISNMQNYAAYLGGICRDLKEIALREELIIFMAVHQKKTLEPDINSISNSAQIGQESDCVMLLQRIKDPDPFAVDFFTPYTKIWIEKNRATGICPRGYFKLEEGRFQEDVFYEQEIRAIEIKNKNKTNNSLNRIYGKN